MGERLSILLVEDSTADAELITLSLRRFGPGLLIDRVADAASLRQRLADAPPDVVLSDFSMPGFSGREALEICRETAPDIPFLFVSGTIGEELAIEALRSGAADYVLKDNLVRLPGAIERALRVNRERQARVVAERALRESEERFRSILESTDDWIWESSIDGVLTYSNPAAERVLGWSITELVGAPVLKFAAPDERDAIAVHMAECVRERKGWRNWVVTWCHREGHRVRLESSATPVLDEDGRMTGFRGIDRDVTESFAQKERIRQLSRVRSVLGALGNAVLRAGSADELLRMCCELAVAEGGFLAATVVEADTDHDGLRVGASAGDPELVAAVAAAGATGDSEQSTALAAMQTGTPVVTQVRKDGAAWTDASGRVRDDVCAKAALPLGTPPWGALVLHSSQSGAFDDEENALLRRLAREIEHGIDFIGKSERLEFLAFHNTVTGLPNRIAFATQLDRRLESGPQTIALFDAVSFHVFNDSRGREFSEALLRAIGARLRELLGEEPLIAHHGDDSFAVALAGDGDIEQAVATMTSLLEACSRQPFDVQGEHVYADLRCGLLQAPRHGDDADTIERNVMSALSEARNTGARLVVYDEAFGQRAQKRIDIERELRVAVEQLQFELFLQPKFDGRTQNLTGAEALLRWRHPQRGLIPPLDFIPLLEETGLILPVGRWILEQAIAISARWQRRGHGGLRLAINVSARELRDDGFLRDAGVLLRAAGPEHGVDVEITESLVMDDIQRSIRILHEVRELGCRVAIDDFGTGYSSLNYLSQLPADVLKIDRSFVGRIAESPESLALVTNTIGLAHALGLHVVAEGVEEEEQAKLLRLVRCDEMQGWLFGRPMTVGEFERQFI
ncbi:EAL domain-containing protein [Arenimonas composti]|uniref:Diguanylate cyclase n=1 Tax=Arenimonas composti TR7-09 = DSM 18010 TaxID=1121013 RepID=A0A091C097_9GAMM|nr:EAL domain-containing protein [Arenimonas composti]KFN50040.1 hypothetical protein P873_08350 [Arenimonas composti TR7-09 = DSM 18010]